jgi:UDP-glucose 4-epimerase
VEGQKEVSNLEDYTSHNTSRLKVNEIMEILKKLDFIKEKLSD